MGDTRLITTDQSSVQAKPLAAHGTTLTIHHHPVVVTLCSDHTRIKRASTNHRLQCGTDLSGNHQPNSHRDTHHSINAGAPQRLKIGTKRQIFHTGNLRVMEKTRHAFHPQIAEVKTNANHPQNAVNRQPRRNSTGIQTRET
jgi:hypothetical protein